MNVRSLCFWFAVALKKTNKTRIYWSSTQLADVTEFMWGYRLIAEWAFFCAFFSENIFLLCYRLIIRRAKRDEEAGIINFVFDTSRFVCLSMCVCLSFIRLNTNICAQKRKSQVVVQEKRNRDIEKRAHRGIHTMTGVNCVTEICSKGVLLWKYGKLFVWDDLKWVSL